MPNGANGGTANGNGAIKGVFEKKIEVAKLEDMMELFGSFDENIALIESETGVSISTRDTVICVAGEMDKVSLAAGVIQHLLNMFSRGAKIDKSTIRYAIGAVSRGEGEAMDAAMADVVAVTYKGRQIKCRTIGQKKYIKAIKDNTVVLCIGPAGTGKTYLAIAQAVMAFKNKDVSRIILTRPAVEAGEKLGFLPGDLQNKVDPYLRPLYDALYDFVGAEAVPKLFERGVIEVAPLAYMRGRTLNDSFIILDEAQNCTVEQMKMFLTRFGEGSKVVVTGDVTQIDLPPDKLSGLKHAMNVLGDIKGLEIVRLTNKDVVRHEMVQRIVMAYEKAEKSRGRKVRLET